VDGAPNKANFAVFGLKMPVSLENKANPDGETAIELTRD
jgi:hypothetical protein